MAEEKKTKKTGKNKVVETAPCNDNFCPKHGTQKLKVRGRTFEGEVIRVLPGRITIQFERMIKVPKYERFERRSTKIHARLPDCMKNDVQKGDLVQIGETRPISKMIHFVVTKIIRKGERKE